MGGGYFGDYSQNSAIWERVWKRERMEAGFIWSDWRREKDGMIDKKIG